jgi:1-acyl-sn-glycerol-3-phosphate acyltransferase
MGTLRAAGILTVFVAMTLLGLPLQWLALKLNLPARRTIPYHYHRLVCRLFGLRVRIIGAPVTGGVLMAANHSGWLDIPILSAVAPVSFVAKREVGAWAFFGTLARLQRTIFISRERAEALDDRDTIRRRLREGDTLVIFPEGTSSDGNRVLPFKSAALGAAEHGAGEAPVPVQPVSITYVTLHGIPMGRENRPFFAWYGDMELVPHLWEALQTGPIDVVVELHAPICMTGAVGRKELAGLAEASVRAGVMRALAGSHREAAATRDDALIEALEEEATETEDAA